MIILYSLLDIQIPRSIPNRCMSLVKAYTNAELTLHDYLKLLRKCKKADADFNAVHPNGGMTSHASIK